MKKTTKEIYEVELFQNKEYNIVEETPHTIKIPNDVVNKIGKDVINNFLESLIDCGIPFPEKSGELYEKSLKEFRKNIEDFIKDGSMKEMITDRIKEIGFENVARDTNSNKKKFVINNFDEFMEKMKINYILSYFMDAVIITFIDMLKEYEFKINT